MSQSLTQIYLHIVFSTKDRRPFLQDPELQNRTWAYLAGVCANLDCPAIKIGGVKNHVHILCRHSKNISVANLIRELKRESSKWIKTQSDAVRAFYWQSGYAAFSISPSHVDDLTGYIENQEEHHKRETYEDELRRICKKFGVELDERYAWD